MGSDESSENKEESEGSWFSSFTEACKDVAEAAGKAVGTGIATEAGAKAFDYVWDEFNDNNN